MKYDIIEENQWIKPKHKGYKLACCDCGLVHYMGITVLDNKDVSVGFKRDRRATGQLRRNNYGNLSQDGRLSLILKAGCVAVAPLIEEE
ncbi:hypothetical protein LCGC14_2462020 [marine sediment metagenome]|uniref:Uncharacterized protein n=1 Tax=marine sediment metagenome TaxID=412755 RepID=A0A0F9BD02_9ZZZZ